VNRGVNGLAFLAIVTRRPRQRVINHVPIPAQLAGAWAWPRGSTDDDVDVRLIPDSGSGVAADPRSSVGVLQVHHYR